MHSDAAGTDLSAGHKGRSGRALVCDAIQAITLRMGGLSLGREDILPRHLTAKPATRNEPHKTPPSSPKTLETHTQTANSLTPPHTHFQAHP